MKGWFLSCYYIRGPRPSPRLRDSLVYKEKYGLLGGQLDPLPDDPHELSHGYIRGNQVLPLVDVHNLGSRDLFDYHLLRDGRNLSRPGPPSLRPPFQPRHASLFLATIQRGRGAAPPVPWERRACRSLQSRPSPTPEPLPGGNDKAASAARLGHPRPPRAAPGRPLRSS